MSVDRFHPITDFKRLSFIVLIFFVFFLLYFTQPTIIFEWLSFIGLIFFIFFIFCIALAQPIKQSATITKVSDGDTVWVFMAGLKVELRLLGIDTPEKFDSEKLDKDACKCGVKNDSMKILGIAASHHAEKLLRKGGRVKVVCYGRGYYGRTLAMLYLDDGSCYNERIVKDGYACLYKYRGHKSKEVPWTEWKKLNQLLKKARRDRAGLWGQYFNVMDCLNR